MTTTEHDALSELFRFRPSLAVTLLRDLLHHPVPPYKHIGVLEGDFTQTMSTEYRADRVLVLKDARGSPRLGVVVEVQRRIDENKRWAWPVYWMALRAKLRCDAVVLVLCLDNTTAAWAAQPIALGAGEQLSLRVVGPGQLPMLLGASKAKRLPELAVLSAMAHGNDGPEGVQAVLKAFGAVAKLDGERGRFYTDLILARLNEAARQELEEAMQKYEYQSEFARKYYGEGLAEGEARGLAEGKAEAVVAVLEGRGLKVTATQRKRILACRDLARLDRWLLKALTATTTAALLPTRKPAARATKTPAARKPGR
ncbi:MAG: hypothetical protein MUF64_27040 [Polyangiaceae bacterium]|jgi:hypothetical protein|nr:hypothetical protein [Polyangiaceae bacterium]